MKFYKSDFNYDYSFPAVSLAYFLRYPNPYAKHVLSTDVIERYIDPITKRLHTTRLHLKKSKVPAAMLRLLPSGLAGPGGASQSYIIEKSTVDIREGWMETESRNMEWTGVLSVVEHQTYKRHATETWTDKLAASDIDTTGKGKEWTSCKTTVTFNSKLGQGKAFGKKKAEAASSSSSEDEAPKQGFFASWTAAGLQRSVELVGVKRTKDALVKSKEGMNVVLERLRSGGIMGVLEGVRRDRMEMGGEGPWKRAWANGMQGTEPEHSSDDRFEDER